MSLIEIVVSVLLLGTSGVSMLSALTATVAASKYERDHARAQVWLQSAIEELQAADRQGCDQGEATVRAAYLQHIRDNVINPPGWADSQVDIAMPVKAWDGERYWDPYDAASPDDCFDNQGFKLQLITIVVTSPDGEVIEQVSVVKG
jgi:type II secretory pathway pseudopilin PulG